MFRFMVTPSCGFTTRWRREPCRLRPNGRVQPRCGAQRSNFGCNPVLGGLCCVIARSTSRATYFFPKMAQPSRMPMPRVSKVGIHIQLIPPIIPLPIMPPLIVPPVIAPPPKRRKSTTTMTKAMTRAVLFVAFMRLISLPKSRSSGSLEACNHTLQPGSGFHGNLMRHRIFFEDAERFHRDYGDDDRTVASSYTVTLQGSNSPTFRLAERAR